MLFTLFDNKSLRYEGASPFTILYIKVNFLICLLSPKFSHPVSKYRERKEANIGSPVTMRAALRCICSNRLVSLIEQPSQTSDPYSSKGLIYVQYNLLSVSLDNLYFNFLRYETCLEADIIIESICLVHLLLAER